MFVHKYQIKTNTASQRMKNQCELGGTTWKWRATLSGSPQGHWRDVEGLLHKQSCEKCILPFIFFLEKEQVLGGNVYTAGMSSVVCPWAQKEKGGKMRDKLCLIT